MRGHADNHKRARRLMRLPGLEAIYQRPRTSRPAPDHKTYPEIVNTDQGSPFTAATWIETIEAGGAQVTMDGKGRFTDNIVIARLWLSEVRGGLPACRQDGR